MKPWGNAPLETLLPPSGWGAFVKENQPFFFPKALFDIPIAIMDLIPVLGRDSVRMGSFANGLSAGFGAA